MFFSFFLLNFPYLLGSFQGYGSVSLPIERLLAHLLVHQVPFSEKSNINSVAHDIESLSVVPHHFLLTELLLVAVANFLYAFVQVLVAVSLVLASTAADVVVEGVADLEALGLAVDAESRPLLLSGLVRVLTAHESRIKNTNYYSVP